MNMFQFLWLHIRQGRGFLWQAVVLILLMAIVNIPLPMLNKIGLDYLIPAGDTLSLITLGALAFFMRGGASAFQVLQNYVVHRVMAAMGHSLRCSMMHAMLHAPYPLFVSGDISKHIGRLASDVEHAEGFVFDTIRFFIRPICMILVISTIMLVLDWQLAVLALIFSPACLLVGFRLRFALEDAQKEVLAKRQALQYNVTDIIENIRAIRCFAREDRYQASIDAEVHSYTDTSITFALKQQTLQAFTHIILLLPWLLVVCIGSYRVFHHHMTLGDMMAFVVFIELLRSPLFQFIYFWSEMKARLVSSKRAREVCDLPDEYANGDSKPLNTGSISLNNVCFAFGSTPLFSNLSLDIPDGQRVALVGPSGGGKTTLSNLLIGFVHPDSGSIKIDGHASAALNPACLRQHIGMVFQDNPMFDGSIRYNLLFTNDPSQDEKIWAALTQAEAREFIEELTGGLDTTIGTRGLKLSGGQRQRLAIARVLLKNPRIVIMDEATSSLDSLTEQRIQQAMDSMLAGRTSVTIAHRLSTIVAADRILYLENGRIIEDGNHAELLKRQDAYYRLYQTQTDGLI